MKSLNFVASTPAAPDALGRKSGTSPTACSTGPAGRTAFAAAAVLASGLAVSALSGCGQESNPRTVDIFMIRFDDGHTVPGGAGVSMDIGDDNLRLTCHNSPSEVPSTGGISLRIGETRRFGQVSVTGLDDRGVDVSSGDNTQRVYTSYSTVCRVAVAGSDTGLVVYNYGDLPKGVSAMVYAGSTDTNSAQASVRDSATRD